ncbi:hypothetical protein scyTo_0011496 [Scyliorhinus torazame]|uniref:Uncharacterized protein n=1 Tax=Scyliorhinus torazame TaxID=75743 RepID=A0A401NP57_SCYTO|nr:hypothetical protein [Scyliorhinus torazame]
MPISSGAEGHIGVGVDTSVKWLPDSGEAVDYTPRRRNSSYLQRYLDTHLFAKRKWIVGKEARNAAEKHSPGSTSIPAAVFKVKGISFNSEQKINKGENSSRLELQVKTESDGHLSAGSKSSSQNRLGHSSLCTVL